MAPTGIWGTLKSLYSHGEKTVPPPFSSTAATLILAAYTAIYVVPFYLTSSTRPSSTLTRDAPSIIRARIRSVTLSCIICSIATFVALISFKKGSDGVEIALHNLGYWPLGILNIAKSLALLAILFAGPLFEAGIAEGAWRDWIRLRGIKEVLGSCTGYRNLIAGPITEEVLFRSASIPLFLLSRASVKTIVFLTPAIFGLAHVHHFYESRVTNPHQSLLSAVLTSLFQLSYTWVFGSFATFLYLRTGSLLACIVAHAFCNWMGLPRVWGRVGRDGQTLIGVETGSRGKDDGEPIAAATPLRLNVFWTLAYYVILVLGAWGFYRYLWLLTESRGALIEFGSFP